MNIKIIIRELQSAKCEVSTRHGIHDTRLHPKILFPILSILVFAGWIAGLAVASEITDTRSSPYAKLHPVRIDEVRWTEGFWADRLKTCRDHSIPAMWELMKGSKYKPFYQHFLIAAGELEGDYHGAVWNDGDFYKWIEAACAALAIAPSEELADAVDLAISAIGRAQRDDGYLHTPVLIRQRHGDSTAAPFQDRNHFEMYNMGHLMTAACLHHRVTGKDEFLKIACKTADFLATTFDHPTPELACNSICPSHYMGVVELYRTTRNPRYLHLAQTFFAMRDLVQEGSDDNQDRIRWIDQREAVGHAVRANYLYAGAADLFLETGDRNLWTPLEAIWRNVTQKKMYITGACGALYDGASPDGSPDQAGIGRVHQAYGRNYQLPNLTAHNETCASIGNVLWNWRMFLATGEARYVDVLERALYNGVLAGVSLDGTNYFYVNPLRHIEPLPTKLRWSRTRIPFLTSFCCPPNVVRTIAEAGGYAYSKTNDTLWINLYGANTLSTSLNSQPLRLVQQTDYPWDGRVHILVKECPANEFAIKARIPGWSTNASVRVNELPVPIHLDPASYVEVRRVWQVGDSLTIDLPIPALLIEAHPAVEETRNQVAIQRGPVVYCLESCDLPPGVRVQELSIPADADLTPHDASNLLGGATVLKGRLRMKPSGDWSETLYRPIPQQSAQEIETQFIPYYAWSNRGLSEMTVWIPVD
ncbi:MAG: glycoside hydrolase family 127 protein [Pirellulales bacterium]|nr:glycoside hydrolase family 127 protein [Pirellulales bacterium]